MKKFAQISHLPHLCQMVQHLEAAEELQVAESIHQILNQQTLHQWTLEVVQELGTLDLVWCQRLVRLGWHRRRMPHQYIWMSRQCRPWVEGH